MFTVEKAKRCTSDSAAPRDGDGGRQMSYKLQQFTSSCTVVAIARVCMHKLAPPTPTSASLVQYFISSGCHLLDKYHPFCQFDLAGRYWGHRAIRTAQICAAEYEGHRSRHRCTHGQTKRFNHFCPIRLEQQRLTLRRSDVSDKL